MMATHHKASFWPHAVGDSLDPAIRKEDRVLTGNLVYIRRTIRVEHHKTDNCSYSIYIKHKTQLSLSVVFVTW